MCSDRRVTAPHRVPERPVRIAADGLVLRAYTAADEPALRRGFEDPDIRRWNPPGPGVDPAAWWPGRSDWSTGAHASWAVAAADDDRLLGDVSLHELDLEHGDAEIGYTVLPPARGRGVARRAVTLAARWGFEELGLFRVQLFHAAENVASCNVALAAGFLHEGTLRQSYRYGDGLRHDEHVHGRLVTDAVPGSGLTR